MRPTREQLSSLSANERITFEIADFLARPELAPLSAGWTSAVTGGVIWTCAGRRLNIVGLEHVQRFQKQDSFVLVANHRSFFDFFIISAILYWRTNVSKRMFYPTRGTFFYDQPLGTAVNLFMSAGRMFPPVLREKEKRSFNRYSLDRCLKELNLPGTILALHPEGTRNKGNNPYQLLKAQPGAGRLALGGKPTIPVFILGMSNSLGLEFLNNWSRPGPNPIDVFFGPPADVADLQGKAGQLRAQVEAGERCIEAIRALGEAQRALTAKRIP